MHKNGRKRTKWDENEHEASSRQCPETSIRTSETAPETDTMEQIDRPRHERTGPRRPSKQPTRSPTSSTPVSPHAQPPDTKNGETRKTKRNEERNGKQRDGTEKRDGERAENTRRRTIINHGYKQRPAEDL